MPAKRDLRIVISCVSFEVAKVVEPIKYYRADRVYLLYLDGKKDANGAGLGADSLANGADLLVGGTPKGQCLTGAIDFLRICHGTLADAETTIDELYTWQFDGPQFRDFCGNAPKGKRDAGAIEATGN